MAVAGQFSSIKLKPWTVFKYLQKYRLDIEREGNCVIRVLLGLCIITSRSLFLCFKRKSR